MQRDAAGPDLIGAGRIAINLARRVDARLCYTEFLMLGLLGYQLPANDPDQTENEGADASIGAKGEPVLDDNSLVVNCPAVQLLRNIGVDVVALRKEVEHLVFNAEYPKITATDGFSPGPHHAFYVRYRMDLNDAMALGRAMGHRPPNTAHALLAIVRRLRNDPTYGFGDRDKSKLVVGSGPDIFEFAKELAERMARLMIKHNITSQAVEAELERMFSVERRDGGKPEEQARALEAAGNYSAPAEAPKGKTPVIDLFCRDLTAMAREGKLDPVIGRDVEVERCMEILGRRRKSNPVLLGDPGVGKTAVAEGLAQQIAMGECPKYLTGTRLLALDMPSLVAGTKYRGQLEERVKTLIAELSRDPNVVLYIDELHTIVGGGSAEGTMDISNMLKPALSRGELRCMAATTTDEYRKYVEKDGALERRFQPVSVNAPSIDDTVAILKGLRPKYEQYHGVTYSDDILKLAVSLADRYISGRFFPDKAIDVMDEVGARVKKNHDVEPGKGGRGSIQGRIEELRMEEAKAVSARNYDLARRVQQEHDELSAKLSGLESGETIAVTVDDVTSVVSQRSKVPVNEVSQDEAAKLMKMEDTLEAVVIGQKQAVKAVSQAVRINRAGLRAKKKPIGSFLFVGPTGVGKTEVAKRLSEYMCGSEERMVRLDMSEYSEQHAVAKLMGAPPGYVGYEEEGILTKAVRSNPYSVILFDEIEKAHPDLFNILLQVLDDGRMTDAKGRTVDFKNTIIIMTSNIGAQEAAAERLGFSVGGATATASAAAHSKSMYMAKLKEQFRPEFLNRIDEVVVFGSLSPEALREIVRLMVTPLAKRALDKGITLTVSERAMDMLVARGYDPKMGARPLGRAITDRLEKPLSEALITGAISSGSSIVAELGEDGETIVFQPSVVVVEKARKTVLL